ncbi:MAG: PAS domain S-box protein, partial [Ignavibacteriales bacterium]
MTQQIEIAINNARHAEALRKAHDELEILVQERTAKLEEINEELRAEIEERKRAEEELRKSEERLQTILDSSTTVIYIKDTESQYITVNRQYETLFHIEREQLKGKTDYDIFPKNLADAFQANDQKVIMAKAPLEFQEIALHDDGLHTYISIKFPLYDSAGTLYAVCGISTDITERIKAREALQRAKDELKVRVQERTAELKKVNKQLRVEIEERKSIEETLQESAARLEEINEELGAEIVEHKRTETALQESEERYRTLVENAPEAIVVLDVEKGCFADANEKAAHLFNLTRAELLSHGPIDLSPPVQPDGRPSSESAVEKIRHAIEGGTSRFEWIHRNSQGEDIPCEVSLVRLPSATRTLIRGSVVDITKRKQAEKILRESEERFRLLVEGVKDYAIFMLDTKGYIASWNAGAESIKGYKSEEIIGKHFSIFYSEEDIENSKPQHGLDVAIRDGRYEDEGWRVRKDGSRFWTNVVITALRDGYGNLRGFSKVTRDITGHKQAEEALKRISHQMELILDSAGEGICGLDIDGNITFTNPSGVKMIEWEAE